MKKKIYTIMLSLIVLSSFAQFSIPTVSAANESVDITKSNFQLSICDGPKPIGGGDSSKVYCDFNGLMLTVQRFINVGIALGVFVALGSFCYVGYLYMTGTPGNITKAKSILPKIFFGFIIMLTAWFAVYQLLSWLGASPTSTSLLG